jgi:hypothetical protein
MSNLEKTIGTTGWGTTTGVSGYLALDNFSEAINKKAFFLQAQLSDTPELTEQIYDSAVKVAEKIALGNYNLGLFSAAATGLSLGLCLYFACKK